MSGLLEDALPLLPRETAFSYASRLAAYYGCQTTDQFCRDFGIDLRKLTRADEQSLQSLAELTCADVSALRQWTIVVKGRKKTINGQLVYSGSTSRSRWRFCPCCVLEDIAAQPDLQPDLAIYARAEWQLDFIRTCRRHKVRLVEYTMPKSRFEFGNFVLMLLADLPESQLLEVEPTSIEKFAYAALFGEARPPSIFDGFELCHVVSMSRAFGACMTGNHVPTNLMDDETASHCERLGFDALGGGIETIEPAMRNMRDDHWKHNSRQGALARFNNVLKVISGHPAKKAMRELVAASYFRHFPEKVGWQVLGVRCDRVRIARSKTARMLLDIPQSLWDAELKTATWKVLDDEDPFYILVDLDAADTHFEKFKPWHTFDWIAKRLGMGNAEVHRLVTLGVFTPNKLPRTDDGYIYFQEQEIEAAIARSKILTRRAAEPRSFDKTGLVTLGSISSTFGISLPELVALIEAGDLEFWYDHGHTAKNTVGAVWVNRDQALTAARGWRSALTIPEAAVALGVGAAAVRSLIASGLIKSMTTVSDKSEWCYLIAQEAVDHFQSEYVTFKRLKQLGLLSGSRANDDRPDPVLRGHNTFNHLCSLGVTASRKSCCPSVRLPLIPRLLGPMLTISCAIPDGPHALGRCDALLP